MAAIRPTDVLIVGAGHAGTQLAVALAKADAAADVTLLGDEPWLPYERPGLSKKLLYGPDVAAPVPLRSEQYWERSPVRLRRGERVVGVDAARRTATTATGDVLGYRTLVWAAGGRPVRTGLPGEDLRGVHSIRDFADLSRLRADVVSARQAVVVGGGYLGLEAAAGLRHLGLAVTVVETAPRLLARVTGEVVSGFFAALHAAEGVDVRTGVGVAAFTGEQGRVTAVQLTDGTALPAALVVVGVGMRPVVETLTAAGAVADRMGLVVDTECRTTLPHVFAIGDCASHHTPWSATRTSMRVESVHNAGQHAAVVVRALAGQPPLPPPPPRFWSTQYGQELKTVGLPAAATDVAVLRGDPVSGQFTVAYLRDGRLAAVDTVNRSRDFARAQALIAAGWCPDPAALVDPALDLPRVEETVAAGNGVAAGVGA